MEADASDHVEVDPSLQLNQDIPMEETPIESQEPETTAATTQEEPENEEQVTEVAPVVNEDEPMTSTEGESTVTEQAPTETEPITTEETPDIADKPMEEEPKQDISEEVKEEKSDKMETATSESPLLSTPASWQIPVAALRQPLSDPTTTTNKATLKKEKLEGRIRENPYDIDAWTLLINDVQQTGDLDVIRDMYERFLKVFPTSPKYWLSYLELELKYSNFNEVEALFTRCLKTVLSVDLWKFYLGYIRRINLGESGSAVTPEARGIIEKAYEYVLNNVGMDRDAGPIWADYIYFLKSAETSNTWEEQRKMDSMRRAYQKAVTIPLNNIEHLWKEYDQWENNLNRLTAKKFLGEKSSAYMTARTALREMRLLTDNINTNVAAVPPQWTANELAQFELWKNYIQWEKNDPLRLEDPEAIMERVSYAYQQAFLALRFYPEIWYSYASYHQEHNKPEKALAIYKQAVEIIPTSLLLNFSYTELCESKKQLEEVRQTYDQLINNLDKEIEELKQKSQQKVAAIQHEADEERASLNLSDDIDGELREQLRSREKQHKKQQTAIEEKTNKQVDIIARACSLVWINYMRFARRTDGIKSARAIFSRARKAANSTYHVYVADALMEYHNSKDATIAGKVFSLGQKSFADNPDFVCQYLDFLIEMNDDNNTRALFERTLATMPPEKAKPIWLKFLDYENKYGDLASVQSVEKRRIEAMEDPKVNAMESFLKRQRYLDIRNIDDYELGGLARQQHLEAIDEEKQQQQQNTQQQQQQQQQQQMQQQQQHILQQQSMKENQKRPLLEPVHPEKYPRPDFNQWQAFKPASRPVNASPIITTVTPTAPPNEPVAPPTSATPAAAVPAAVIQQQQASPIEPLVRSPVPPAAAAAAGPWPSNALPDAVAYFVSNLPPAHTFNGPLIQAAELVDVLRNIPLQPQQAPPPLPRSKPMPNRDAPRGGNYNNRPPARGPGGFNKRGGSSRGGGNKQNQKRRARDDYDDDYQTHKGMGPNRPPDFDVFRQRQAKRHRDEPY